MLLHGRNRVKDGGGERGVDWGKRVEGSPIVSTTYIFNFTFIIPQGEQVAKVGLETLRLYVKVDVCGPA